MVQGAHGAPALDYRNLELVLYTVPFDSYYCNLGLLSDTVRIVWLLHMRYTCAIYVWRFQQLPLSHAAVQYGYMRSMWLSRKPMGSL